MVLHLERKARSYRSVGIILTATESCWWAGRSGIVGSRWWSLGVDPRAEAGGEWWRPWMTLNMIEIEGRHFDFLDILGRLRLRGGLFIAKRGSTLPQPVNLVHIVGGASILFLLSWSIRCLQVLGALWHVGPTRLHAAWVECSFGNLELLEYFSQCSFGLVL